LCIEAVSKEASQARLGGSDNDVVQAPSAERDRLTAATRDRRDSLAEKIDLAAAVDNAQGYAWADQGVRLDEAKQLIEAALTLKPGDDAYLDSLGWVYYKLGRFDEAIEWLKKSEAAARGRPDSQISELLDHQGDALWRANRLDEARSAWRRAGSKAKLAADERGEPPEVAPAPAERMTTTRPAAPPR
jgi:tetratricopeptide (TPR) repeat protein